MNWYRLHEIITRIASASCRHPEGVVCPHRQYEYDQWYRGYNRGFLSGQGNMEAKWRGNVTGEGVYADYPVPELQHEAAAAMERAVGE